MLQISRRHILLVLIVGQICAPSAVKERSDALISVWIFLVHDRLDVLENMFKRDVCNSWSLDSHALMESLATISLMTMQRAPIIAVLCVTRHARGFNDWQRPRGVHRRAQSEAYYLCLSVAACARALIRCTTPYARHFKTRLSNCAILRIESQTHVPLNGMRLIRSWRLIATYY